MPTAYRSPRSRGLVLVVILLLSGGSGCSVVRKVERRPAHGVDLNTATAEEIAALPGLSESEAERIIRERPFESEDELVRRGLVTHEQLTRFDDRTYVSRKRAGDAPDACTPTAPRP